MLEPASRERILNVISLEISDTPLADKISPPRIVKEIDWVENFWPTVKKGKVNPYPKVQLYCLMGVGSAWTVSVPGGSRCFRRLFYDFYRTGISTLLALLYITTFCVVQR